MKPSSQLSAFELTSPSMMMMRYGPRMELDFEILAMGMMSFVLVNVTINSVLLLTVPHTFTKHFTIFPEPTPPPRLAWLTLCLSAFITGATFNGSFSQFLLCYYFQNKVTICKFD